jgi:hypothetical protein
MGETRKNDALKMVAYYWFLIGYGVANKDNEKYVHSVQRMVKKNGL